MKIQSLNKNKKYEYSIFGTSAENIFSDEGFGLKFSFEIYKLKLRKILLNRLKTELINYNISDLIVDSFALENIDSLIETISQKNTFSAKQKQDLFLILKKFKDESINFSNFLDCYFDDNSESELPHYLPMKLKCPELMSNNFEINDFINEYLKQKTGSLKNKNIVVLLGHSGSGKTSAQLYIAYQTKTYGLLSKDGYIPYCLDDCISRNYNIVDINKAIADSLGIKSDSIDNFFRYSPPLLFLIDLNAISSVIFNRHKEISISVLKEIIIGIDNISRKFKDKHKLLITYRGTEEFFKMVDDPLYEFLKNSSYILELQPIDEDIAENYLLKIGAEKSIELKNNFLKDCRYLLQNPIILDSINWIVLQNSTISNIKSKGHLYLILTREILRLQYKQWEKRNILGTNIDLKIKLVKINTILSKNEKDYARTNKVSYYSLEKIVHPVDLILQLISKDLGSNFSLNDLENKIENIVLEESSKLNEQHDKSFTAQNFVKYTLLKNGSSQDSYLIEFLHSSFGDFYKAKSYFFNPKDGKQESFKSIPDGLDTECQSFIIDLLEISDNEKLKSFYKENKTVEETNLLLKMFTLKALEKEKFNNYSEAIEEIDKAIELAPEEPTYYIYKARMYENINNMKEAVANFKIASRLESLNIDAFTISAKQLFDYDSVKNNFSRFTDKARVFLGNLQFSLESYYQEDKNDKLIKDIEEALFLCKYETFKKKSEVKAFVIALFYKKNKVNSSEIKGSLLKRFGKDGFPDLNIKDLEYAVNSDSELERFIYQELINQGMNYDLDSILFKAYNYLQVRSNWVNLDTMDEAIEKAYKFCRYKDNMKLLEVKAFINALYKQHKIERASQVGGSLLRRFGNDWFPEINDRELYYALDVYPDLERIIFKELRENNHAHQTYNKKHSDRYNLDSLEEAIRKACHYSTRKGTEEQLKITAFITVLYKQHKIERASQIGGSLLRRFGSSWFPEIKDHEIYYALDVDEKLEKQVLTALMANFRELNQKKNR